MDFKNDKELQSFLSDTPYFSDNNSYCIGNTLEEAASIIRQIVGDLTIETTTERSTVCGNG